MTRHKVWGDYRVLCSARRDGVKCVRASAHDGDHEGSRPRPDSPVGFIRVTWTKGRNPTITESLT